MKKYEVNAVSKTAEIIINGGFILFSLACVLPLLLVVSVSFTSESAIMDFGYSFIPKEFSLDAYDFLFSDSEVIFRAYGVTIFVTIVGSLISIISMTLYAYPLSREDFPFKSFFNVYLLITLLFSGGLVASYMVNVTILGLKNTVWALIVPSLGGGFSIFVIRTYFKKNIPSELIEAAVIDGAGEFRTFVQIILPVVQPIIASMLLFSIFGYWNNWTNSLYYISTPKLYTLQHLMQQAMLNLNFIRQSFSDNLSAMENFMKLLPEQSVRMAMVVVGVGPIVAAYPFFQKYFIQGLTEGSVKG